MLQTQKALGTDDVTIRRDETVKKQESNMETKLAWLGGFLDAEATFYINRHPGKRSRHGYILTPMITLPNTDFQLLESIYELMGKVMNGGSPWFGPRQSSGVGNKPQRSLVIHGLNKIIRFVDEVLPHLNSKVEQAELLREFAASRCMAAHRAPYSDREIQIVDIVKRLNHEQDVAVLIRQYPNDQSHWARMAGLYEGDGSFTLMPSVDRKSGSIHHIRPIAIFTNTSVRLLEEVKRCLDSDGVKFVTSRANRSDISVKPSWHIRTQYIGDTGRVLRLIRPHMLGEKIARADLVLEFCDRHGRRSPYSSRDIWIMNEVRRLNNQGTKRRFRVYSPTTLRLASLSTAEEMTKSGLHGDMQSVAEMTTPTASAVSNKSEDPAAAAVPRGIV